jgi:hypothetical protein
LTDSTSFNPNPVAARFRRASQMRDTEKSINQFAANFQNLFRSRQNVRPYARARNTICGDQTMFGRAIAARLILRAEQNQYPTPIERYTPRYPFHGTQNPVPSVAEESRNIWTIAAAFIVPMIGGRRIGRFGK